MMQKSSRQGDVKTSKPFAVGHRPIARTKNSLSEKVKAKS